MWPILTLTETKIREVKGRAQRHTARKEESHEFDPGLYGSCSSTTPQGKARQYGMVDRGTDSGD